MQETGRFPGKSPSELSAAQRGARAGEVSSPAPAGGDHGFLTRAPAVSLPKGGGAVKGIGEKFTANPVTGTGAMSVPIAASPSRSGFGPQLALSYDSGAGQGPFGLGWSLSLPAITRKTDKGLPQYLDDADSDVFVLSGAEDLVPVYRQDLDGTWIAGRPGFRRDADGFWVRDASGRLVAHEDDINGFRVRCYRPRIEGQFARIERWSSMADPAQVFWRATSPDNVTSWYGRSDASRVRDPAAPARIFQWLLSETHDDKGNVVVYHYKPEDGADVDRARVFEANRPAQTRHAATYLHRITYGNRTPYQPNWGDGRPGGAAPSSAAGEWMFEVLFDFGEYPELSGAQHPPLTDPHATWVVRDDPFSSHRAGFEVRTWRLCRRVLMVHHFPDDPDDPDDSNDPNDPDDPEVRSSLVRSTDFHYERPSDPADPARPGYTVLRKVTHRSYQQRPGAPANAGYEWRAMPPVEFSYSRPRVGTAVQTIAAEHLPNMPVGTQGPGYQWVDLDGEGLSGVLCKQAGAWTFAANRGGGRFGPARVVAAIPAIAASAGDQLQLMDLAGDGEIDLVEFGGPIPGFHERDRDQGWKRHVPFASLPNIDWQDANLRFLDLTGNGHADALLTENEVFTWHPSLQEQGFGEARRERQAANEEAGPRLVFGDGTQTIFLADMCGDGLTDLVRIRNGEVCYWPNLGYGRFGRKVTLANAPRFDAPDLFDPQRIRLADIDGSGPTDILYLGRGGAQLYFNRSGNSLSNPKLIPLPVATENVGAVQVTDLLGTGTACLVWNSHLPADATHPVRYVDLMADGKPHLLTKVDNHLGATTEIEYTPSTRFYLDDLAAGAPWATRLPFPVHCVSRVTVSDRHRQTSFTTHTSYHHGHFDGVEREFCGFGCTQTVDVLRFKLGPNVTDDVTLYQPPVKTVTWYHTGAADDRQRILGLFEREYFPARHPGRFPAGGFAERTLPQPEVDAGGGPGLDAHEWREAMRACKGMVLRQEVYELDLDALRQHGRHVPVRLFTAAHHNCHIRRLQPRATNPHAVFQALESEALTYHYELDLKAATTADPRVAHNLHLRFDEFGRPQQSVAAMYPRWGQHEDAALPAEQVQLIRAVQSELHLGYTEVLFTAPLAPRLDTHRLPAPCQVLTYELTGIRPQAGRYFSPQQLRRLALSSRPPGQGPEPVAEIAYQDQPAEGLNPPAQKRLVEHVVTRYFRDDLSGPLPLAQEGRLGLVYETYKLALTESLLRDVLQQRFDAPTREVLDRASGSVWPTAEPGFRASGYQAGSAVLGAEAPSEAQWWQRSGIAGFAADAASRFYLPDRYIDPFGNVTTLAYGAHGLYVRSTTDALGNTSEVLAFDHRVLAPRRLRDINQNVSEVAFDIRGLPVAAAIRGKVDTQAGESGDTVQSLGFDLLNPSDDDVARFFQSAPLDGRLARRWLGQATTRFVYHFGAVPAAGNAPRAPGAPGALGIQRERHERVQPNLDTADRARWIPVQMAFEYSDGSGQPLLKKVQAEPDPADPTQALRWITTGKTVLNNKGKPVRQYEPYFSSVGHVFEEPREEGVSATMHYDAPGRLVRTDFPDGTLNRTVFSPWRSEAWDACDTVEESEWRKARRALDAESPLQVDLTTGLVDADPEQRAGWLSARHAGTPGQVHFDSLGREVVSIAHNRVVSPDGAHEFGGQKWKDVYYLTFTKLDAEGKPLWIRDARGNLVMQYVTPHKPTRWADAPDELPFTPAGGAPGSLPRRACKPCYDIAGNLLHQHSMDAGDRWMLMNAAGQPMLAWDINDRQDDAPARNVQGTWWHEQRRYSSDYDALQRPTAQWLQVWRAAVPAAGGAPLPASALAPLGRVMLEHFEYQDAQPADSANLNGQLVRHFDASGLVRTVRRSFAGHVTEVQRQLVADGRVAWVDWQAAPSNPDTRLETDTYIQITEHDALGRMTRLYNWHRDVTFGPGDTERPELGATDRVAVYVPAYNERGLLRAEWLHVRARKTTSDRKIDFTPEANPNPVVNRPAIVAIAYNAKGQKTELRLGNGTVTRYTYDPNSFRLTHLYTRRDATHRGDCAGNPDAARPARPCGVQNLHYVYDAVGNITHIRDDAQQTIYFRNAVVEPSCDYTYDALYRLVEASGREQAGVAGSPRTPEGPWPHGPMPSDRTLRRYTQRYEYDAVGNFELMVHEAHGTGEASGSWTRHYATAAGSNRLLRTWEGSARWADGTQQVEYRYDTHGSMLNLKPAAERFNLHWDQRDMIRHIDLGGGGNAWYQYDSSKQRTRKLIVRNGGNVEEERLYLGGFERYRRTKNNTVVEEIESHHLFEGEQRVLLVDDVLKSQGQLGSSGLSLVERTCWRYQYGNHQGSVGVELDEAARGITYEECHPYGTSAYRLMNDDATARAPPKRYRYTGMERDEEMGVNYHSMRYLSPLLGRWMSCDSIGVRGGINLFEYASGSPVVRVDRSGLAPPDPDKWKFNEESTRRILATNPRNSTTQVTLGNGGAGSSRPDHVTEIKTKRKGGKVIIEDKRRSLQNPSRQGGDPVARGRDFEEMAQQAAKNLKNAKISGIRINKNHILVTIAENPAPERLAEIRAELKAMLDEWKTANPEDLSKADLNKITIDVTTQARKNAALKAAETAAAERRAGETVKALPQPKVAVGRSSGKAAIEFESKFAASALPATRSGPTPLGQRSGIDALKVKPSHRPALGPFDLLLMAITEGGHEPYEYTDDALVDWKLGLLDHEPAIVKIRAEQQALEAVERAYADAAEMEARRRATEVGMRGASFGAVCPACPH